MVKTEKEIKRQNIRKVIIKFYRSLPSVNQNLKVAHPSVRFVFLARSNNK